MLLDTCYSNLILVTWYLLLDTSHLIFVTWYLLLDTCFSILVTWYMLLDRNDSKLVRNLQPCAPVVRPVIFILFCKYPLLCCTVLKNDQYSLIVRLSPMNSTKSAPTFEWIFHFSYIHFSRKIFENSFYPWGPPWACRRLGTWPKYSIKGKCRSNLWNWNL